MTSSGTHLVPVYTPTNMFPVEAVLCPDSASLLLNEQSVRLHDTQENQITVLTMVGFLRCMYTP